MKVAYPVPFKIVVIILRCNHTYEKNFDEILKDAEAVYFEVFAEIDFCGWEQNFDDFFSFFFAYSANFVKNLENSG